MTTDEKIDQALEDFQFLEEQDKENVMIEEYLLYKAATNALKFQVDLLTKASRNDSNALKFKSSTNVLIQLLKAYKKGLDKAQNYERQAFYWKMKYEGVMEEEKMQEILKENLKRLLNENERLIDKIETLEK